MLLRSPSISRSKHNICQFATLLAFPKYSSNCWTIFRLPDIFPVILLASNNEMYGRKREGASVILCKAGTRWRKRGGTKEIMRYTNIVDGAVQRMGSDEASTVIAACNPLPTIRRLFIQTEFQRSLCSEPDSVL